MPAAGTEICFFGDGGAADDQRHKSGVDEQGHHEVGLRIFWVSKFDVGDGQRLQDSKKQKQNRAVVLQMQLLGDEGTEVAEARWEETTHDPFEATMQGGGE